jgi:CMP-N,N'-diacetyllegionaminic acid synthase
MPSILGLIPARSGSKRLPNKNISRLGDHPLMAYAISSALGSGIFASVMVSTDSEAYADIARYYGAEVPFLRPPEFATATSPDIEWVDYTLDRLSKEGREYDCFSILRPSNPFRRPATIRRAWDEFLRGGNADSLRAVEPVRQHPGKMWVVRGRRMMPLLPLSPAERPWHSMQMAALPEVWVQNASLEIAWSRIVCEGHTISGATIMPFFTSELEGFDINSQQDWDHAQALIARDQNALPPIPKEPYPERPRTRCGLPDGANQDRGRA